MGVCASAENSKAPIPEKMANPKEITLPSHGSNDSNTADKPGSADVDAAQRGASADSDAEQPGGGVDAGATTDDALTDVDAPPEPEDSPDDATLTPRRRKKRRKRKKKRSGSKGSIGSLTPRSPRSKSGPRRQNSGRLTSLQDNADPLRNATVANNQKALDTRYVSICVGKDRYLTVQKAKNYAVTVVTPMNDVEKKECTFKAIQGVATGANVSLESVAYPGHFLHNHKHLLEAAELPDDAGNMWKRNCCWRLRPALNGSPQCVTLEALGKLGHVVREDLGKVMLAKQEDDEVFVRSASWRIVDSVSSKYRKKAAARRAKLADQTEPSQ